MGWARIDDGFHDHPKLMGLSLDAVGLWTLSLSWAHRHHGASFGLLGHLPEDLPSRLAGTKGKKLAAALIAHGLWEVESNVGGWVIHDYVDYLPAAERPATASDVRAARSEAGKRGAEARWGKDKPQANELQPDSNLPSDSDSKPMPPTRPDPTRPTAPSVPDTAPIEIDGADDTPTTQTIIAEWIERCAKRPPGNVVGQMSKTVAQMLTEGIDPDDVRRGVAAWMTKGLHPSTLPSVVNEVMNTTSSTPKVRDKFQEGLALAERMLRDQNNHQQSPPRRIGA